MPRDDLRNGRISLSYQIYHITICTNGRQPVFTDFYKGRLLTQEIGKLDQADKVKSLAWVIMPDHMHWLMQLTDGYQLSTVIRELKGRSARCINKRHDQSGSIWQRGFHDHAIRKNEDLISTARYIVANPLRAGLVERIGDYPLWDCIWL